MSHAGIAAIFAWRIFAKFLLHRILPPVYRFLSQLVTLPNRRFYTPATDYKGVPPEKHLRALPSVLDLPGMVELEVDGVRSTAASRGVWERDVKLRNWRGRTGQKANGNGNGNGNGYPNEKSQGGNDNGYGVYSEYGGRRDSDAEEELGGKAEVDVVKHYDADGKSPTVPDQPSTSRQVVEKQKT